MKKKRLCFGADAIAAWIIFVLMGCAFVFCFLKLAKMRYISTMTDAFIDAHTAVRRSIIEKTARYERNQYTSVMFGDEDAQQQQQRVIWQSDPDDHRFCGSECACSTAGLKYYGKYCGIGYTGCLGEPPCDDLDACCMVHDECVGTRGMRECDCHAALVECALCRYAEAAPSWCDMSRTAAANVIADIAFVFPQCVAQLLLLQNDTLH